MSKFVLASVCLLMSACGPGTQAVQPTAIPAPPTATAVAPPNVIATPTSAPPIATSSIVRPSTTLAPRVETVDIRDNHFIPGELAITAGTRVQWMNNGENTHDVVANDHTFSSSTLGAGARFMYTFQTRGRFEYFCTPHMAEGMVGAIVVE